MFHFILNGKWVLLKNIFISFLKSFIPSEKVSIWSLLYNHSFHWIVFFILFISIFSNILKSSICEHSFLQMRIHNHLLSCLCFHWVQKKKRSTFNSNSLFFYYNQRFHKKKPKTPILLVNEGCCFICSSWKRRNKGFIEISFHLQTSNDILLKVPEFNKTIHKEYGNQLREWFVFLFKKSGKVRSPFCYLYPWLCSN